MNIICINPQTDPLWVQLIDQYQGRAFHSPRWIRVLTETYGFEVKAYVLLDDAGTPQAGLSFCEIEDIKGKRIAVMPFSDYCDPLVSDMDQWNSLVAELINRDCPVSVRCLQNQIPLADERFECYYQAKWHGLDLRPDLDTLWNNLEGSARRAIRKAEKSGVVVQIGQDKEDLRAFFNMHLGVRKYTYNLVAQPYSFFEQIWQQFVETQNGMVMLARHEGNVIGGIFFLEWKDGLYYKFNASNSALRTVRPNDMMIWEGIKYGKAKGFTHLDFGLSDWDQEGLVRYKRKFASEEKAISFLRHNPDSLLGEQDKQIRGLLPQLTDLFTQESVPDSITEKAGEILYRYFV